MKRFANIEMKLSKSDKGEGLSESGRKEPNYIKYLVGLAILLFAGIIGYNAFVVPDIDTSVQTVVDITDFRDEKSSSDNTKININKAEKEELTKLDGIGEQTALKIIEYRETHGGFSSKEELMEVIGIGEKTFERVRERIAI